MATFDKATAVQAATDGTFTAELDPEWTVGGRPHGGYLLAVLGRATLAATPGHPHPLSASAVYASSPDVGPATVSVEVMRRGRLASQVRARLVQAEKVLVEATFVTGALDPAAEVLFTDAPAPDVAPIERCTRMPTDPMGNGFRVAMLDTVAQRIDQASFTNGMGDLRGWLAFDDGTPFDGVSLLYVADSFPPPTLALGSVGWVPTLSLSVYLRAIPAPGPLRMRQRARVLAGGPPAPGASQRAPDASARSERQRAPHSRANGEASEERTLGAGTTGFVDIMCEAWDSRDRVVMQATQLAAVRMR